MQFLRELLTPYFPYAQLTSMSEQPFHGFSWLDVGNDAKILGELILEP